MSSLKFQVPKILGSTFLVPKMRFQVPKLLFQVPKWILGRYNENLRWRKSFYLGFRLGSDYFIQPEICHLNISGA